MDEPEPNVTVYKKQTCRENYVRTRGVWGGVIYKPRPPGATRIKEKGWEDRSLPVLTRKDHDNHETINFCCLSHSVSGPLFHGPRK